MSFLFLASPAYFRFGFGLGALGLALKLMLMTLLSVNVQNYIIARAQGWRYRVWYQVQILGVFVAIAMIGKLAAPLLVPRSVSAAWPVIEPIVGGAIYTVVSVAIVAPIAIRRGFITVATVTGWINQLVGRPSYPVAPVPSAVKESRRLVHVIGEKPS